MKYFTLKWWEGKVENQMAVNDRSCRYMESVKKSLPKDLWRLYRNVSLHDAHLRRLHLAGKTLELKLDGERRDKGKYRPGRRRFQRNVSARQTRSNAQFLDLGFMEVRGTPHLPSGHPLP